MSNVDMCEHDWPVSESKAQGVVQWPEADEIMQMAFEEGHPADDASGYYFELEEFDLFIERLMSEVARLNAATVQKASVPDDFVCDSKPLQELLNATAMLLETPCPDSATYWAAQLASVEQLLAAPAADAGLVEALRELAEQFREAWPDHTGKYHFLIGAGLSIAASRAKGVV